MKRPFDIVASGLRLISLSPLFAAVAAPDPGRAYVEQVMPDNLAIDLEYVGKANLWTDIKLIFSTFKEIIVKQ